jgi:hypothetical protein
MGLNADFNIHKIATAFYCIFLCVFYFPGISDREDVNFFEISIVELKILISCFFFLFRPYFEKFLDLKVKVPKSLFGTATLKPYKTVNTHTKVSALVGKVWANLKNFRYSV